MADRLSDSMREELESAAGVKKRFMLGGRSAAGGRVGTLHALTKRGLLDRSGAITAAGRKAIGLDSGEPDNDSATRI